MIHLDGDLHHAYAFKLSTPVSTCVYGKSAHDYITNSMFTYDTDIPPGVISHGAGDVGEISSENGTCSMVFFMEGGMPVFFGAHTRNSHPPGKKYTVAESAIVYVEEGCSKCGHRECLPVLRTRVPHRTTWPIGHIAQVQSAPRYFPTFC